VDHASGARMWDADGNEFIDYVCSWGALILGHAHPKVVQAISEQARRGTSYGMPTELEVELATRIRKALPSCEKVRFVSSGTEATMSAVRLARAATNRDLIVKFDGCYHGHSDSFLSEAGSGLATLGIAACPGVPQALAELTLNAPYNDAAALEKLFDLHRNKIAAVIVEPIAANMGVVPPQPEFLKALREITIRHGALLIFDEVITGFRMCYGGAQTLFGIEPDLTTLGKIIGGGLPERGNRLAGFAGRPGILRIAGRARQASRRRHRSGARRNGRSCHGSSRRLAADIIFLARAHSELCRRQKVRHATLRTILPRHARSRNFPCAIPV
jgi:glutamate-1-semialdehyde 2,1-aminomutase